jgi:hypothetical protein
MNQPRTSFDGFVRSNTTPIPDVLFDELLSILSGAELKVLLYIMRRTWGFKKDSDAIALSQFEHGITTRDGRVLDRGCGLHRETICKALKSLEKLGCIKSEKQVSAHGDKDITVYKIRFRGESEVVEKSDHPEKSDHIGSRKKRPQVVGLTDQGGRKKSVEVVGKSDLQETVQETGKQETERETPTSAPAQSSLSPHAVDSLSQEKPGLSESTPSSLFASLTDEQADFWRRWCALSHCGDDALTEKQLPDIAWLAERISTTADLESLYRSNASMLLALSQAKETQYTPPHLKNLIKHHPTWASAQDAKQKQREQASQKAVSGTGAVKNWTMARLSGQMDASPVVYPDVEKPKKPLSATESMSIKGDLAAMLERMRG